MKPFRFRAAPVLDLRLTEYDAARMELAKLTELERQAAWRADEATERSVGAEGAYRERLVQGADGDELARHRNWITLQHTIVEQERRALDERRKAVALGAAVVLERFKRVKVLERLRDRSWKRYQDDERRHDAKEMDLLAVLQYARRIAEGGSNHDS